MSRATLPGPISPGRGMKPSAIAGGRGDTPWSGAAGRTSARRTILAIMGGLKARSLGCILYVEMVQAESDYSTRRAWAGLLIGGSLGAFFATRTARLAMVPGSRWARAGT